MVFTKNEIEKLKELKQKFTGCAIQALDGNKANIKNIYFDMDKELLVIDDSMNNSILELDCSARGKMNALEQLERIMNEKCQR